MSALKQITEAELKDMYNEDLDSCELVRIGSLTYYPSTVLEAVDPIAYRCGYSDYVDYLLKDNIIVEDENDSEVFYIV